MFGQIKTHVYMQLTIEAFIVCVSYDTDWAGKEFNYCWAFIVECWWWALTLPSIISLSRSHSEWPIAQFCSCSSADQTHSLLTDIAAASRTQVYKIWSLTLFGICVTATMENNYCADSEGIFRTEAVHDTIFPLRVLGKSHILGKKSFMKGVGIRMRELVTGKCCYFINM